MEWTLAHETESEPVFVNLLGSPGIDSQPGGPVRQPYLSYRPAMLQRLAESNPRNRFLVSLNVYKYGLRSEEGRGWIGGWGVVEGHGPIKCRDTKTKCRLYWCLIELIDWIYSQLCWYFRPSFVNYCLCNLLSGSTFPTRPPLPKVKVQYMQTVCGWEGGGGVVGWFWRPYIFRRSLTRSVSNQIQNLQHCFSTQNKTLRRGGGLRQINTCRKVTLKVDLALLSISLIFLQGRKTRDVALLLRKMVKSNLFYK